MMKCVPVIVVILHHYYSEALYREESLVDMKHAFPWSIKWL